MFEMNVWQCPWPLSAKYWSFDSAGDQMSVNAQRDLCKTRLGDGNTVASLPEVDETAQFFNGPYTYAFGASTIPGRLCKDLSMRSGFRPFQGGSLPGADQGERRHEYQ